MSAIPKSFNGIVFAPNECKQVDFYINHPKMVLLPKMPRVVKTSEGSAKSATSKSDAVKSTANKPELTKSAEPKSEPAEPVATNTKKEGNN